MPRGKKTKERKILATVLETWYQSLCIAMFKNTISCIEQSFGLCGRGRGWDDLGEWH